MDRAILKTEQYVDTIDRRLRSMVEDKKNREKNIGKLQEKYAKMNLFGKFRDDSMKVGRKSKYSQEFLDLIYSELDTKSVLTVARELKLGESIVRYYFNLKRGIKR